MLNQSGNKITNKTREMLYQSGNEITNKTREMLYQSGNKITNETREMHYQSGDKIMIIIMIKILDFIKVPLPQSAVTLPRKIEIYDFQKYIFIN